MPRDHRPEEETYSHASRESDRNGNDTFHRPNETEMSCRELERVSLRV